MHSPLSHKPASASISAWAFDVVQTTPRLEEEIPRKVHDIQNNTAASLGLSDGEPSSYSSMGDLECILGRLKCTCSSFNVGPATSIDSRVG
jgi:hypothetical protein